MPDNPQSGASQSGAGFNPVTDEKDSAGGAQGPAVQPAVQTGTFDNANQGNQDTPTVTPTDNNGVPQGQVNNKPPQAHPISKAFDSIFKTISGGPIYVNDPDGTRREVPQSKGSMARAITAAALAGLFAPNAYRPGAFGGSVRDTAGTMANAAAAGKAVFEARAARPQEISDDLQARKLMTAQNNANQVSLSAAMSHQRGVSYDNVIDNTTKMLEPVKEVEKSLGADAVWEVPGGMSSQEVLNSGHNLTDSNVVATGKKFVNDANGIPQPELTYGILKNNFSLKLPEEITQELAKFDMRFENLYKATGGNVMLPINAYVNRMHVGNRLINAEGFLDRVNKQVNGDDAKKVDLAAAYKANPAKFEAGLEELEHDMAAGTGRDEGSDDHLVNQMRTTPSGTALLGLVGEVSKTDKWAQESEAARERKYQQEISAGKAAGKNMYTPITAASAPGIIADPQQPASRRTQAQSVLDIVANQKERLAKAEQIIRSGDPLEAGKLLASGDLSLQELKSRGSTPDFITKAVNAANSIDRSYNAQQADAEYKVAGNPSNVVFFGSAKSLTDPAGTLDQLLTAHSALGTTRIPIFNSWDQALEFQAGDPALATYMQTALGVADDYAKVLGGGNQPTKEMQLMQLNAINGKLNEGQISGVVRAMRGTVNSQVNSRIGNNRLLRRMYGTELKGYNQVPKPTAAPPMTAFVGAGGKPLGNNVPVTFRNGQTWQLVNGVPTQVAPGK